MTPPPSVSSTFDQLEDRSSQVAQTSVENTAEISAERDNILQASNNYQENRMAQSKSDNIMASGSNESRTGNMMIDEMLEVAGNASPVLIQNNFLARNVLFEDLPSDSENIIKILENTIHIKTLLQQQNEFLAQ
ncbi:PREDICTED: uncharacterized protein LOC108771893 [Cyphomyrmex costatus]|uniref:uncharacterized protein LOC108771893 n=1 Tax=Cyphomyrmex costatus TaxID=456900 RepID=UPI0008522D9C|nr:PREDICTED: uncharacterized protein LOC108771893 [Cyphomyrmex costatus]